MPEIWTNNAVSTLASAIASGDTSITVQTGDGALFPSPSGGDYFWVTLEDSSGNIEIVRCTARAGDTLTVERGQQGTTAQAFSSGDAVEVRITAGSLREFRDATLYYAAKGFSGTDYYETAADALPGSTSMTAVVLARVRKARGAATQVLCGNYRNFAGGGWKIGLDASRVQWVITESDGNKSGNFVNADWLDRGAAHDFATGSLIHVGLTYDGTTWTGYVNGAIAREQAPATGGYLAESGNPYAWGVVSFDQADPFNGAILGSAYTGTTVFTEDQMIEHFLACQDALDMVDNGLAWEHLHTVRGETTAPATIADLIGTADLSAVGSPSIERRNGFRWIGG